MTFPEYAEQRGIVLTQHQEKLGVLLIKAIKDNGYQEFASQLGTGMTTMLTLLESYFKYEHHR
jgi:hypothetical protein